MQSENCKKNNLKVIDRDVIKYIAVIPMIIGHTVSYFQENGILYFGTVWNVLAAIALFAPPVFFFSISDGYIYTRSKKQYALRLLIFAVITQIPFALVNYGTIFTLESIRNLNVFFTLLAGLCAIIVWESNVKLITRIISIVLIDALTVVLGCEWMIFGVPIILGMHIFRDAPKKRFIFFAVCTIATQFITWCMNVFSPSFITGTLSMFASYFFRTTFYNGKKGKHPVFAKWFFYIVYPLHFTVIYILILIFQSK
ncbi:MAG: TraX family protein [Hominimerdicola sp.]